MVAPSKSEALQVGWWDPFTCTGRILSNFYSGRREMQATVYSGDQGQSLINCHYSAPSSEGENQKNIPKSHSNNNKHHFCTSWQVNGGKGDQAFIVDQVIRHITVWYNTSRYAVYVTMQWWSNHAYRYILNPYVPVWFMAYWHIPVWVPVYSTCMLRALESWAVHTVPAYGQRITYTVPVYNCFSVWFCALILMTDPHMMFRLLVRTVPKIRSSNP